MTKKSTEKRTTVEVVVKQPGEDEEVGRKGPTCVMSFVATVGCVEIDRKHEVGGKHTSCFFEIST